MHCATSEYDTARPVAARRAWTARVAAAFCAPIAWIAPSLASKEVLTGPRRRARCRAGRRAGSRRTLREPGLERRHAALLVVGDRLLDVRGRLRRGDAADPHREPPDRPEQLAARLAEVEQRPGGHRRRTTSEAHTS